MSSNYPAFGNAPGRSCQRCGRPLPPNEAYCANCGLMNTNGVASPSSGSAWGVGGPVPQQPFGTQQMGGQQWGPPPASPNNPFQNANVPQQSFGQPQQSSPNSYPFYGSPNQSSPTTNSFFGTPNQPSQQGGRNSFSSAPPQQPLYAQPSSAPTTGTFQNGAMNGFAPSGFGQQPQQPTTGNFTFPSNTNTYQAGFTQSPPLNGYSQQGQPQAPQVPSSPRPTKSKRPKVGLIITIIVLLVLVVGGGIGSYLYVKHHNSSPTVQNTPTVVPTATPTGKTIFNDTFANNNNGWDLTTKPGAFSVKVGGGSMVLEDDNNRLLWELLPGNKNFSDFYMTVDATLSMGTQNNGYGIYIRGASNQTIDIATYYRFEIYGDGTFAIFKGSVDASGTSTSSILVNYANSPAIQKQGQVNHIAINASGSKLTFYVNGQIIKIVNDNTYNTGSIAFFVSNLPHTKAGAQATFANLAIYPPQS